MKCKDCEHFHIDSEPMMPFEMGRASCDKHDLIVDYLNKRKLNRLTCVEEQEDESDRQG